MAFPFFVKVLAWLGVIGWVSGTYSDMDWRPGDEWVSEEDQALFDIPDPDPSPYEVPIIDYIPSLPGKRLLPGISDTQYLVSGIILFGLLIWGTKS